MARARRRAAKSSVRTKPRRASATARQADSPASTFWPNILARTCSAGVRSIRSSQDQSTDGSKPNPTPFSSSAKTCSGTASEEKAARSRPGCRTWAKLFRTVVSTTPRRARDSLTYGMDRAASISAQASSRVAGPRCKGTPRRRKRSCSSKRERSRSSAALPKLISPAR